MKAFGITCVCIGMLLFGVVALYQHRIEWVAATETFDALEEDTHVHFLAESTDYALLLEFDHSMRQRYWECVYGMHVHRAEDCRSVSEWATVEWKLMSDGKELKSGTATGPNRRERGRNQGLVARFETDPDVDYRIIAALRGPDGILSETKPRIKVVAWNMRHAREHVVASLVNWSALGFLGIGVIAYVLARNSLRTVSDAGNAPLDD